MTAQRGSDLIRTYFLETAVERAPAGLLERSLGQTAAARQRRPWWVRAIGLSTARRTLRPAVTAWFVATLVGALILGGLFAGGLIPPVPPPTPETTTPEATAPDGSTPATPVENSQRVGAFRFPFTAVLPGDARFAASGPGGNAAHLTDAGTSEVGQGIWIMVVEPGWVHTCFNGATRVGLGSTPLDAMTTMGEAGGIELSELASTSVDGRPGYAAEMNVLSLGTCRGNEIHPGDGPDGLSGFAVRIAGPARLIAFDVLQRTVLLMLWAGSDSALDEWLPTAQAVVDSIRFDAERPPPPTGEPPDGSVRVDSFVRPFEYVPGGPYAVSPGSIRPDLVVWRGREVHITLASAETMWVHGCGAGTEAQFVRHDPEGFMADLRDVAGLIGDDSDRGMLDGRPGRWANVLPDQAPCRGDVHLSGPIVDAGAGLGEHLFDRPGKIIAADVAGATLFVVISAPTLDALGAGLPDAMGFVHGIEFLDRSDLEARG